MPPTASGHHGRPGCCGGPPVFGNPTPGVDVDVDVVVDDDDVDVGARVVGRTFLGGAATEVGAE